ncbi:C-22 sterol desaturase [Sugiyamaella lignohabitans]|uniref:C-22 sterol desaturase n=1 Tax=Sugiyamaella lignohabitans TaxID=796027 RepID=A0A161HH99_9ASCO|nr:C-22 sterol desaturase [Sugiyamaella lignohabitans]ANB15330.1 C-22 sterol desaturase [Sugiyamaella lignohabitans]
MNILTIHPENIKAILATNFKDYSLGLRYKQFLPLLGDGIFTLSGSGWKHSRAMLRPQFSREQVSQLESLNDHVSTLLTIFKEKSQTGQYFDAQKLFHNLTLDTATEFLFGESCNSLNNESRDMNPTAGSSAPVSAADFADSFNYCLTVLALRSQAGYFYWLFSGRKFISGVKTCKAFVDYFVRRALRTADEKKEEGRYIFIEELTKETRDATIIRDQSFNILLAGRDTTASLLSYITYYLARDKRVLNKLREVVLEEFGTEIDNLTFESLKRCTYLNHVINEVLRLNPIVPLNFRSAVRDTILPVGGGPDESQPVFVEKGTQIVYSVYALHRNPKYWGEDAEEFRPERWSEGKIHNWDFLPFNGGPRICLGQQFALTETSYTVVRVLQTFKDINLAPDQLNSKLLNNSSLTSSVANGVRAIFTPA